MARRCDICGKKSGSGHNVSHSKRRTNRRWHPNIQPATLQLEGVATRVKICTRCLRSQMKVTA